MKLKTVAFLLGIIIMPLISNAQFWELGVFFGGSNYSGDLSPAPIEFNQTHGAIGGLVRYNFNDYFTMKGNIYYGKISGTDENAETEQNRIRNLSFQSNVIDIGANAEWNIMGFQTGDREHRFSPYLFGGLSIFKFDPMAPAPAQAPDVEEDELVRLQPLGTEGQGSTSYNEREKYALTQVAIPFGAGLKFNFTGNWNMGFEVGWRKTFTDYLDDVSMTYPHAEVLRRESGGLSVAMSHRYDDIDTRFPEGHFNDMERGNPTNKDWFIFAGLTLTYTIMPPSCYKF